MHCHEASWLGLLPHPIPDQPHRSNRPYNRSGQRKKVRILGHKYLYLHSREQMPFQKKKEKVSYMSTTFATMDYEKTYNNLHNALRDVMGKGENGKITFFAISGNRIKTGDLDIRVDLKNGRVVYETMTYKRLSSIQRISDPMTLTVRVFEKTMVEETCNNPECKCFGKKKMIPLKRIYAFVWTEGNVFKLSAEDCKRANCMDPAGNIIEPEVSCSYL